jgi:hypothetical protein
MRTGDNRYDPPGQILQVMPWPEIGKTTDRDLQAICEYLRALPNAAGRPSGTMADAACRRPG